MKSTTLTLALSASLAVSAWSVPAAAQPADYPERPIQMIVPFPPGGSTDIMARVLSASLQESLGQAVVIQNRSGAGGVIGTEAAVKSDPDGYTLLLSSSAPLAVGLDLNPNIAYDVLADLTPVSMVGEVPLVLVTHPDYPVSSVDELIARAKAQPDEVTFALNALGSQSHLLTELFQLRTETSINMIPYKGSGPAVVDLLGGVVSANIENMPAVLEHIRNGRLRPLAILSAERSEYLPDVPTFSELGMEEFVASPWFAMMAPHGTDPAIVAMLNERINQALASDAVIEAFSRQGAAPVIATPEETSAFISEEIQKWSDIVRETGATLQ